jgi:hypothetical protein
MITNAPDDLLRPYPHIALYKDFSVQRFLIKPKLTKVSAALGSR